MTTTARPLAFEPASGATRRATKLLVAVHGIGDQIAYETIQSVALRVGAHLGQRIAMPLGRFYPGTPGAPRAGDAPVGGPILLRTPDDPRALHDIGLAEAYWASIPREVASQKFVLEETKKWARTIAGRVAYQGGHTARSVRSADRLVVVLDELVETIRLLERLCFLADKAGVFRFDLGKLLVDFVGDVQLVADFEAYRQRILDLFDSTVRSALALAPDGHPRPDLYVIAHSEGSVIAFIALLEAMNDPDRYPWITRVSGLMTIGSPIEIHHLLWPHLWRDAGLSPKSGRIDARLQAETRSKRSLVIPWHNYLDDGDPIAYELTCTEDWLTRTGFGNHFRLRSHEFSRYYMPGKAHVDYWNDREVFGHFLTDVVGIAPHAAPSSARAATEPPPVGECFDAPPDAPQCRAVRTRVGARIVAWFMPWLLVGALLLAGVYAVESATAAAIAVTFQPLRVARDVVAFGLLVGGVTAAARLPRLNDCLRWRIGGLGLLAVCYGGFALAISPETRSALALAFTDWSRALVVTAALAVVVALLSGAASRAFPRVGHLALPALGIGASAYVVWRLLALPAAPSSAAHDVSLWPLAVGGAFFLYLWWLAALLFDLSFVWQRYVRNSVLRTQLVAGAQPRG